MSLDSDRKYHLHSLLHLLVLMWHPYLWLQKTTPQLESREFAVFWILYLKGSVAWLVGMDEEELAACIKSALEPMSLSHEMRDKKRFFESRII